MRLIKAGATDQSVMIRFLDGTTGLPVTSVVAATSGLAVTYRRTGAAAVALNSGSTPAINDLAALTTAHTDAGMKHVSDGWYRFDLPDDAVSAGVTCLVSAVATGLVGFGTVLQLVPFDPQAATNLGLSALPIANPGASGGVAIVGSIMGKSPATLAAGDVTGNLPADLQTIKTQAVTASAGVTFPASIGTGTSTYAGADTAGTTTLLARVVGTLDSGTHKPQTGDAYARLGAPAGASVSADIADLPTVAEFNARTLVAASYFDPAVDTVARVTLVDTTTTLTNMPAAAPSAATIKTALEADGSKLDHLWEMTEDDGGVRRLTANALEQAPSGGAGTSDLDELIASHDTEDTLGNVINDLVEEIGGLYRLTTAALAMAPGGGATTYSYSSTVDDGSGNLLDGVFVQCATDTGFTNVVYTTHTNGLGAFTVYSDIAGTHYLRLQLSGYSFTIQTVTLV